MLSQIARKLAPIFGVVAAMAVTPTLAATVYESADYVADGSGAYTVADGRSIGIAFSLSEATNITAIGAAFGPYPGDSIFAAIVPLSSLSAYPDGDPSDLSAIALAHVVFSVPDTDVVDLTVPLKKTLAAGDYALIFGSGQFGADGYAGLTDTNSTIGSPTMFQTLYDNTWQAQDSDGIRIFVEGNPVPEPVVWAMMLVGFGLVGAAARARRFGAMAA